MKTKLLNVILNEVSQQFCQLACLEFSIKLVDLIWILNRTSDLAIQALT